MAKSAIKTRKRSTPRAGNPSHEPRGAKRAVGRPPRAKGFERRQIVVNTALLAEAMRYSGLGQSDVVNTALEKYAEDTRILAGLDSVFGAFPDFPGHGEEIDQPPDAPGTDRDPDAP